MSEPAPAMHFEIITLFPELFDSFLSTSLLGRAIESGQIRVDRTNPRDFASGPHRQVDDTPYGGGPGMVLRVDVTVAAMEAAVAARGPAWNVLLTPQGEPLTQARVGRLAERGRVMLVCGRYEGIDERLRAQVDQEIALGDFVLSGGEIAAMAVIDAVSRLVPGMLGKLESTVEESFSEGLLEYPHYTRPAVFRGAPVPAVLSSGHHERIRLWRRRQRLLRTQQRRPDLFARLTLSEEDCALLSRTDPDDPI